MLIDGTDVQEGNLMVGCTDNEILEAFEEREFDEPSPRKTDGDYVIYASRELDLPDEPDSFILCDFGDAQFGQKEYVGEVMPDLYRAPEIILKIPWNEKIDIWSTGLMASSSFG